MKKRSGLSTLGLRRWRSRSPSHNQLFSLFNDIPKPILQGIGPLTWDPMQAWKCSNEVDATRISIKIMPPNPTTPSTLRPLLLALGHNKNTLSLFAYVSHPLSVCVSLSLTIEILKQFLSLSDFLLPTHFHSEWLSYFLHISSKHCIPILLAVCGVMYKNTWSAGIRWTFPSKVSWNIAT